MTNLPARLTAALGRLHLPRGIKPLLLLLCSLLCGLLPPLLLLLIIMLWYFLPEAPGLDLTWLTLAAGLLAPFCAGFAACRWRGGYSPAAGAGPAFLLWAGALAAFYRLFGLPNLERAGLSLIVCLLSGLAGGMSAEKIRKKKQ